MSIENLDYTTKVFKVHDKYIELYMTFEEMSRKDGWAESMILDTRTSLYEILETKCDGIKSLINSGEFEPDAVEADLKNLGIVSTYAQYKDFLASSFERAKKEDQMKQAMKEYELQKQEALRKEEAFKSGYVEKIEQHMYETKRTRCVDARELSEKMFSYLSNKEREQYYNQIFYAAFKNLETPLFEKVFTECLDKYQGSLVIQKVISDYLDVVSPKRDRDEYELDKLISMLPDSRKELDDRTYQAYTAICWLHDEEMNKEAIPEIDLSDLEDDKVQAEFVSQLYSDVEGGEPYNVAYRNSIEKAIGTVSKQYGKMKAFPKHIADIASQSLSIGEQETLGEKLYTKIQKDKEIEKLVSEKESQRLEFEQKLEEERLRHEKSLNDATTRNQQQSYNRNYPYYDGRYNNYHNIPNTASQMATQSLFSPKIMGIGVNVVLLLLCLLFEKITGNSTALCWVGLAVSTYGWIIAPSNMSSKAGQFYESNQSRFTSATNNKSQSKCMWYIIGGYIAFFVAMIILSAF
jgi:hypothetical protein